MRAWVILTVVMLSLGFAIGTNAGPRKLQIYVKKADVDLKNRTLYFKINRPADSAEIKVLSPDGKLLAAMAGGAGGEIKVWETTGWTELYTLSGHSNWIRSIAFAPDGQALASGSTDSTIRLWDTESGRHMLSNLNVISFLTMYFSKSVFYRINYRG